MVNFVGAGPGAVDLITLRGKKLIEQADIIIYAGSLVNPELLKYSKKNCKIYNSAEMTLEEIEEVFIDSEKNKKNIVRLHTGDPAIYGAIKEQMDILDKYGIEYDICPGVSSLFGASAALKAEYTIPGESQSVIVTRMEGRTPVPEKESISSFASHNATMVIFLSAGMTKKLSEKLIEGGYSPDTPAAIIYKATWKDEKVIITTISNLTKSTAENNITKTALIVIGHFLNSKNKRSKLYDPLFSHQFRFSEPV